MSLRTFLSLAAIAFPIAANAQQSAPRLESMASFCGDSKDPGSCARIEIEGMREQCAGTADLARTACMQREARKRGIIWTRDMR